MVITHRLLLIRWIVITLMVAIKVEGWRVVFKVSKGGEVAPANSVYELWNSSDVVYDNPAGFHNTNLTYMSPYQPTYKSEIVNKWKDYSIKYIKLGLYKSGKEVSVIVFNGTDTNKTDWFDNEKILQSPYSDLTSDDDNMFSLQGTFSGGRFQVMKTTQTYNCLGDGWIVVIDKDVSTLCGELTGRPYFYYSNKTKSVTLGDAVADSFAVFVDDCVVNPCQRSGTCTTHMDGYICQCADQVYGHSCQYECPCENHGVCHAINDSYIHNDGTVVINGELMNNEYVTLDQNTRIVCQCPDYYFGATCNKTTLKCASSPCQNYGTCIEGYTFYTCKCTGDYTGVNCTEPRPATKESGMNIGAKVAVGICVPLVVLIFLVVGYVIYMYKNPEAYGHKATMKQYTIAREFVRRSMRRMSGRRDKRTDETKDTVAFSPKEKDVNIGQVNLAFDDGGKASYTRQNSEYYNLSAGDNAVVSGQSNGYHVQPSSRSRISSPNNYDSARLPHPGQHANRDPAFSKEYKPTPLQGTENEQYTHPGHGYDEYNRSNTADHPLPQPRKPRQTGRRGRHDASSNDQPDNNISTQNTHSNIENLPSTAILYPPTGESAYLGGLPRREDMNSENVNPIQPPRYEMPRSGDKYNTPVPPGRHQYPKSHDERLHAESRFSPGYQRPQNDHDRSRFSPGSQAPEKGLQTPYKDSRYSARETYPDQSIDDNRYSPGYRPYDDRHSPGYRQPHHTSGDEPSLGHRQSQASDDRLSPGYRQQQNAYNDRLPPHNRQNNEYDQRSPRHLQGPNSGNDKHNEHPRNQGSDRIVFTSSEPMEDVTV